VQERLVVDEIAAEFTAEELQEFLKADLLPTQADPAFKGRLRRELWEQLARQRAGRAEDPSEDTSPDRPGLSRREARHSAPREASR